MRRILWYLMLLVILVVKPIWAFEVPEIDGRVTDKAGLYSLEFKSQLEEKLAKIDNETRAEVAVLTINKLPDAYIEEYAVEVFEKWGIGKAKEDNGVLLVIAKDDREVRIEVGYGLEGAITDGRAGEIIRNEIVPQFKLDNYELGTMAGVEKIEKYIRGEVEENGIVSQTTGKVTDFVDNFKVLTLGFLFLTYMAAFFARTKEFVAGGIVGFILGIIFGNLVVGIILAIIGLIFDLILSRRGTGTDGFKNVINPPVWKSNSWKSSGWKSGGGGFGGFGGGRSGGGGASGKW